MQSKAIKPIILSVNILSVAVSTEEANVIKLFTAVSYTFSY